MMRRRLQMMRTMATPVPTRLTIARCRPNDLFTTCHVYRTTPGGPYDPASGAACEGVAGMRRRTGPLTVSSDCQDELGFRDRLAPGT